MYRNTVSFNGVYDNKWVIERRLMTHPDVKFSTICEILIINLVTITKLNEKYFHDKTKHIEIKYRLVRKQLQQENILVVEVLTKDNVADLPTKPFYYDLFWTHMTECLVLIHTDVEFKDL